MVNKFYYFKIPGCSVKELSPRICILFDIGDTDWSNCGTTVFCRDNACDDDNCGGA